MFARSGATDDVVDVSVSRPISLKYRYRLAVSNPRVSSASLSEPAGVFDDVSIRRRLIVAQHLCEVTLHCVERFGMNIA